MKASSSKASFSFLLLLILISTSLCYKALQHPPIHKKAKEEDPPGQCTKENDSVCCTEGKMYKIYECSPPVSSHPKAHLNLNSFEKGGDGGVPSECNNQYHSDDTPLAALSTGWFNKSRCLNNITIRANGRSVVATVVDECDSTMGCYEDHDYQPPCSNNIADSSMAVWEALGFPRNQWSELEVTWSDA